MNRRDRLVMLSERQGHRCAYCGFPMWLPGLDAALDIPTYHGGQFASWRAYALAHREALLPIVPRETSNLGRTYWPKAVAARRATPDHVLPKHRGGVGTEDNLVAACYVDNVSLKGPRRAREAAARIQRMVDAAATPTRSTRRPAFGCSAARGLSGPPGLRLGCAN